MVSYAYNSNTEYITSGWMEFFSAKMAKTAKMVAYTHLV